MARLDNVTRRLTEPVYKVPYCIQDTIPIYRISESGIFELERKKGVHQFDRVYLFHDINFYTQDEEEKELTEQKYQMILNAMNVSYKIIISNHYSDNEKLMESILHKAVSEDMIPLAKEYHALVKRRLEEGREGLLQSKYFVISCEKPDFESARNFFRTLESTLQPLFKKIGSGLIPLSATDRLRALHSFYRMGEEKTFDFDWDEYLRLKRDWRNDIINTKLKVHPEYMEHENHTCSCALFVRKYASGISDLFMNEITNVPFPLIYTIDCEPVANDVAYHTVMDKYMSVERSINKEQERKNDNGDFSTNISYEKRVQAATLEGYLEGLRSYNERLFFVGMTFLIKADSMEELEQRKEKLILIGNSHNMEIAVYSDCQLEAMNTTLPTGARFVNNMRTLTTPSLSIFTPFNVQEISEPGGYCYGFNQVSKNLILGNRKALSNGNGFVFGIPGAGKSMNEKYEMGQVRAFSEDDIIVIDPMGEYKDIAAEWKGEYINLSKSSENKYFINPFHVPAEVDDRDKFIQEKAEFAYAIAEQALKPEPLTNRHISVVDAAVIGMYEEYFAGKQKKNSPTIKTLREKIKEYHDKKPSDQSIDLLEQLEVFTDGTLDIFAHQQSKERDNRFTVYGFADMGKRMRTLAMLIMMETITIRIKYNQRKGKATWVYVDEIHELWAEEYSRLAIERMWREVRKRGGICTGMTQNLNDALANNSTKSMVSNSEFKMILNQGVMDRGVLEELFEVSETQAGYVNGADKGTGLLKFGDKLVPFDNSIDKDSKLYHLFNTNFHEMVSEQGEEHAYEET